MCCFYQEPERCFLRQCFRFHEEFKLAGSDSAEQKRTLSCITYLASRPAISRCCRVSSSIDSSLLRRENYI